MKTHDQHHECTCDHDAADLAREMQAGRPVHEYRERRDTGETVLVCLKCNGLWDHRATDRVIEFVMRAPADPWTSRQGAVEKIQFAIFKKRRAAKQS
jgi:hypothetical protein